MNFISPQWALVTGLLLSTLIQNSRWQELAKRWSPRFLQLSVVLLGSSLNFHSVLNEGLTGALITLISILIVFLMGHAVGRLLNFNRDQELLITMGTAICGGSAISALSPVIKADSLAITVSIGVVFLLNALALFLFPTLGHALDLTQEQFGLWAALAIHDTSSVVAASAVYGSQALETATTLKLIRALWIIPIVIFFSVKSKNSESRKIKIPWFILGFLAASLIFTFGEISVEIKEVLKETAKSGFAFTLFLIGLSFEFNRIKEVGLRPLIFGTVMWFIIGILSVVAIKLNLI